MDANNVLDAVDNVKESIKSREHRVSTASKSFLRKISDFLSRNKYTILVLSVILSIVLSSNPFLWLTTILGASILYMVPILKEYIEYKKEKELMDSIDLTLIGHTLEKEDTLNKRSLYDLLSEYVTNCFERDVIIFFNLRPGDVVNSKLEEELLEELEDSAIRNMGPLLRKKLELYFGKGRVDIIIGRLCFLTVSIYAANSKKNILSSKPLNN